jgi:K(+)-stimulated pyrophosphate-energized sodium pump
VQRRSRLAALRPTPHQRPEGFESLAYAIVSELVVVLVLCLCSLIVAASQARGLSGQGAEQRELDRLLGAVDRASADFLWHETRLIAGLLLLAGFALAVPMLIWHSGQAESKARLAFCIAALFAGAGTCVVVARVAQWSASRAIGRCLAALRHDPDRASPAVFRGALVGALVADAASTLLTLAVFLAHYLYLTWVVRLDPAAALQEATRSAPAAALGALCAAVIFQVGGSSFHTAAGVSATNARARHRRLLLDAEQNPALVAELVGDYVGGVVLRSSDVFCALVLANCSIVLLASSVGQANPSVGGGVLVLVGLPLIARASGLLATAVATGSLRWGAGAGVGRAFFAAGASHAAVAATGLFGAALWLLGDLLYTAAFGAGALGILAGLVSQGLLLASAQRSPAIGTALPAASVARALGLGLQRAWAPLLIAGACLATAYTLGARMPLARGGAFALLLAVATMLGSGALHLCSSSFSSISDSVRRIVALRRGRFDVRARGCARDLELAALTIGNLGQTQGILGSAAAALLGAVTLSALEAPSAALDSPLGLNHPVVILGGILGAASLFSYVGGVLQNSSRAASALDAELSEELNNLPRSGAELSARPSYRSSVQRAASAATEALLPLTALAVLTPMVLGLLVRLVYGPTGGRLAAHGLMAFASSAVLTGCFAALVAQGALVALGSARLREEQAAQRPSADSETDSEQSELGGAALGSDLASNGSASASSVRDFMASSAREYMGRCVGPAAVLGLKATVVSALAIAPLLF